MRRTRYNIGDDVIYKGRKTYVKDVLSVGQPTLYVLPKDITVLASELRRASH